eukprot:8268339-Alexandrium_andersonii.AAC.1
MAAIRRCSPTGHLRGDAPHLALAPAGRRGARVAGGAIRGGPSSPRLAAPMPLPPRAGLRRGKTPRPAG